MNKARAMLDSLMGPNRDTKEKNKEKFKDHSVCKAFLLGLCPMDAAYLGGKRNFKTCTKIHSEIMRDQLNAHPDAEKLKRQYELEVLPDFNYVIDQCEKRIVEERKRIREDWGNRVRPLPADTVQEVYAMKRAHGVRMKEAESLDDDKFELKIKLMREADELAKEAQALEERELKKAKDNAINEEVCEICGTSYLGSAGNAAHLQFRIHNAYSEIRDKHREIKDRIARAKKEGVEPEAQSRSAAKDGEGGAPEKSKGDRDASRDTRKKGGASRSRGRRGRGRDDSRGRGKSGKDRARDSRSRSRDARRRQRDSRSRDRRRGR